MRPALPKTLVVIAAASMPVAAAAGMAFAGWMNNGSRIIMTMAQTGLTWCF